MRHLGRDSARAACDGVPPALHKTPQNVMWPVGAAHGPTMQVAFVLRLGTSFRKPVLARASAGLLLALSALLAWTGDVRAQCAGAGCVVTTTADTLAGAGTSLRDAITYANSHPGTSAAFLPVDGESRRRF